MTREIISNFQGKDNVTKITSDNGSVSYLTASTSFSNEAYAKGACALNTVENEKKHVLFLFNAENAEVGRYYLGKKLQGQTPSAIAEQKHCLVVFESFNKDANGGKGAWVPCIGLSQQEDLAKSAVAF